MNPGSKNVPIPFIHCMISIESPRLQFQFLHHGMLPLLRFVFLVSSTQRKRRNHGFFDKFVLIKSPAVSRKNVHSSDPLPPTFLSRPSQKYTVPGSVQSTRAPQNVPWVSDVFSGRSHLFPVFICVDSGCVDDFRASQLFVSSQVTSAEVPDALQHWFLDTSAVHLAGVT